MNFRLGRRQTTTSATSSLSTGRQSSPDDNWETLDLSSTEYARMRKEMMQVINDLRSLGQVKDHCAFRIVDSVFPVRKQ